MVTVTVGLGVAEAVTDVGAHQRACLCSWRSVNVRVCTATHGLKIKKGGTAASPSVHGPPWSDADTHAQACVMEVRERC